MEICKTKKKLYKLISENNLKIFTIIRDPVEILLSSLNHRKQKIPYSKHIDIKEKKKKFKNLNELVDFHKKNNLDKNNDLYDMYIYEIIFLNFNIDINDLIENYDYKYIFTYILKTYSISNYFSLLGGYSNIKKNLLCVLNLNSENIPLLINYIRPELGTNIIREKLNENTYTSGNNPFKNNITNENRKILEKYFEKDYKLIEKMKKDGILNPQKFKI